MKLVRVKLDIGGTFGDEAWAKIRRFEEVEPRSEVFRLFCGHDKTQMHTPGEWGEVTLRFEDFIAEYAVAFYLKQKGVIDADVEPEAAAASEG
jgi:hypothetical protein